MSDARAAMLNRIRAALGPPASNPSPSGRQAAPQIRPHWEEPDRERFTAKLAKAGATWTILRTLEELPGELDRYLNKHDLERKLLASTDEGWAALPWNDIRIDIGPNLGDGRVSLTSAYGGIAETGTLVLLSSESSPTTLNFLSEYHVVLLRERDLVRHMEDIFERMRKEMPTLSRTVNLITGPSRTADIEQTIQLGAHGPRQLHVVLLAG